MQKRAILRAIFNDSDDGLKNAEEILKDIVNAKVINDVKTLLHLCQYAELENKSFFNQQSREENTSI